ncbi:MAG: hypothetical protein WDM89_13355 [Rhizomicrobium sp.]
MNGAADVVPRDPQDAASQPATGVPLPQQTIDAAAIKSDAQSQTSSAPSPMPAQTPRSSVMTMFSVLRSAITEVLSPRHVSPPNANEKAAPPAVDATARQAPTISTADGASLPARSATNNNPVTSVDFVRIAQLAAEEAPRDKSQQVVQPAQTVGRTEAISPKPANVSNAAQNTKHEAGFVCCIRPTQKNLTLLWHRFRIGTAYQTASRRIATVCRR